MSFAADLAKFENKVKRDTELMFVSLCLSIQKETMRKTPVDTGRLRSNWFLGVNKVANSEGEVSYNIKLGDVVYLTNNLPYARRIEYEGWSNQASNGMLMPTVMEHQAEIRKAGFNVEFK